tara:strand:- start:88 stop:477 length:390 start_codon:yes stop_codon:yes gene_type:complete
MEETPTYLRKDQGAWKASPALPLAPTYTRRGEEIPGFLAWIDKNSDAIAHLQGFLSYLHEEEYADQVDLDYALSKPWKYTEAYLRFTQSLEPQGPQDLDPEKQARQDQLDCKVPERWETNDLTEDDIPF